VDARRKQTSLLHVGLIVALAIGVFVLDLLTPLGVSVPELYVALVLFSLWSPQQRLTLTVATASTALTGLGFFFSPPGGGTLWMAIANRLLTVFVVWATAILVLRYKHKQEEIKLLRGLLPICASCKKIRDDKGYWNYLELYMEDHSDVQFSHGICPECLIKWYPELEAELSEGRSEAPQEDK